MSARAVRGMLIEQALRTALRLEGALSCDGTVGGKEWVVLCNGGWKSWKRLCRR